MKHMYEVEHSSTTTSSPTGHICGTEVKCRHFLLVMPYPSKCELSDSCSYIHLQQQQESMSSGGMVCSLARLHILRQHLDNIHVSSNSGGVSEFG